MDRHNRNYSTISPSAKSLLLMKGLTNIPFARQAAELMSLPGQFIPDYSRKDFTFWARVAHFENRYQAIDQLLEDLPVQNILELSSGFSFRGLDTVKHKNIHYIDTDLPEIIKKKKEFVSALQGENFIPKGKLEILPLNALDEKEFMKTADHFDAGEIAIVNEGLLMYLDTGEKEKLCAIIHNLLKQRGGYWITADIYIKHKVENEILKMNDRLQQFLDQHRVEENKFESLEAAGEFFRNAGFMIDKEAAPDYSKLSSLPYFIKNTSPEKLEGMRKTGKIHTTWRLKVSG